MGYAALAAAIKLPIHRNGWAEALCQATENCGSAQGTHLPA